MANDFTSMDRAIRALEKKSASDAHAFLIPMGCSLEDAENELGLMLPPSYRAFLERAEDSDIPARDIVEENRLSHEDESFYLPSALIAFFHDGFGNSYCFDAGQQRDDGEYPIFFWDHELTCEENIARAKPVAQSFGGWLADYASAALPEKAPKSWTTPGMIGCLVVFGLIVLLVTLGLEALVHWLGE